MFHVRFLQKYLSITLNARLISGRFPQVAGLSLHIILIPKTFIQRIKFLYCPLRRNAFLLKNQWLRRENILPEYRHMGFKNVFKFFIKGINSNHISSL